MTIMLAFRAPEPSATAAQEPAKTNIECGPRRMPTSGQKATLAHRQAERDLVFQICHHITRERAPDFPPNS